MLKTSDFVKAKKKRKKWAILTAYDAPTAELVDEAGVDIVLVGDSLGMVLLGYPSTAHVTMDEMIHHAKAARRGVKNAVFVGDMPLKGIEKGPRQALVSARRFMREAGCDAVKIEWGPDAAAITSLLVKNRIPVMGHVGLTPQRVKKKEGFKVKGRDAAAALSILEAAREFERRGAFMVVLECVPEPVSREITRALKIPTIGIGAGAVCDGQVLVFHDLVGIFRKFTPRFVKHYARLGGRMKKAVEDYARDVRQGRFPSKKHTFKMAPEEFREFRRLMKKSARP